MNHKFAAPRRRDDAGWKKLQWMIENGWSGYDWPVSPQMNLGEVREALRERREQRVANLQREKEAESFEKAARDARRNARNSRTARKRARLDLIRQRCYQDAVLARVAKGDGGKSSQTKPHAEGRSKHNPER